MSLQERTSHLHVDCAPANEGDNFTTVKVGRSLHAWKQFQFNQNSSSSLGNHVCLLQCTVPAWAYPYAKFADEGGGVVAGEYFSEVLNVSSGSLFDWQARKFRELNATQRRILNGYEPLKHNTHDYIGSFSALTAFVNKSLLISSHHSRGQQPLTKLFHTPLGQSLYFFA